MLDANCEIDGTVHKFPQRGLEMRIFCDIRSHATRLFALACLAALTWVLSPSDCFAASHQNVTGMFTDMTYNDEAGDVNGIEVFLVYSNQGYFAVYQSSEGEPSAPVVVPAKVKGASVTFQVPATTDSRGTFTGTVDSTELSGIFSGNGQAVHLKRKQSYWQ